MPPICTLCLCTCVLHYIYEWPGLSSFPCQCIWCANLIPEIKCRRLPAAINNWCNMTIGNWQKKQQQHAAALLSSSPHLVIYYLPSISFFALFKFLRSMAAFVFTDDPFPVRPPFPRRGFVDFLLARRLRAAMIRCTSITDCIAELQSPMQYPITGRSACVISAQSCRHKYCSCARVCV